jgi:hypothetical protein
LAQPALVVPAGDGVVIAPRGAAVVPRLRPVLPPVGGARTAAGATATPPAQAATIIGEPLSGGLGLAAPALLALPLAALGALAAGGLPGSGSGTTAPARTR